MGHSQFDQFTDGIPPAGGRQARDGTDAAPPAVTRSAAVAWVTTSLGRSDGTTTAVLVDGALGVGRSHFAGMVAAQWRQVGGRAVEVAATRSAATVPFGSLAPLVAPSAGRSDDGVLDDLRRAITAGCRALSTTRPGLVVVDDAHLLDAASLQLLSQVIAERSARFVLTAAERVGGSPGPWSRLTRRSSVASCTLGPLTPGEVDDLLRAELGSAVGRSARTHLWHRSLGNPLVLVELLGSARRHDLLRQVEGQWVLTSAPPLTERLVAVVGARLEPLGADARAGLELVALAECLPPAVLDRARPGAREALSAAGLVVETDASEGPWLRCSHPMWREVAVARLGPIRRRSRHQELRAVFEPAGRGRRDDELQELLWSVEAGEPLPTVERLLHAARLAEADDAPALAERLAELALHQGGDLEAETARLDALAAQGRATEAHQQLSALTESGHRDPQAVEVTVARRARRLWPAPVTDQAVRILVRERNRAEDPADRLRIAARLAELHVARGDARSAVEAAAAGTLDAEDDSRGEPDPRSVEARMMLLKSTASATALARPGSEALSAVARAEALARRQPQVAPLAGGAGLTRCYALHHAGRLLDAEVEARAGYERSLGEGRFSEAGRWALSLAGRLLGRGRLQAAVAVAGESVALLEAHGEDDQLVLALAEHALAAAMAGKTDVARKRMTEHDEQFWGQPHAHVPVLRRAQAWLAAREGRRSEAVELTEAAAEAARRGGLGPAETAALTDTVRLGAPGRAADRLAELARAGDGPLVAGAADLADGSARGQAELLDDASIRLAEAGADLVAAEASFLAADLHRHANDRRSANVAGLRAQFLLGRCDPADLLDVVPVPSLAAPLTPRELQIAALAATGATSTDIADGVHLARRTVDNHLRRVYSKLDVRSRAALATLVDAAGVGPAPLRRDAR